MPWKDQCTQIAKLRPMTLTTKLVLHPPFDSLHTWRKSCEGGGNEAFFGALATKLKTYIGNLEVVAPIADL